MGADTCTLGPELVDVTKNGVVAIVVTMAGGWADTPVYKRDALRAGNVIAGPALIEEHASTTVVQPGDELRVDGLGNLQIAIGSDRS